VLNQVLDIGLRRARQQNAMNHSRVSFVQRAEGPLVAGTRRAHETRVLRRMPGRKHGQRHAEIGTRNLHHFERRRGEVTVSVVAQLHRIVIDRSRLSSGSRLQLTSRRILSHLLEELMKRWLISCAVALPLLALTAVPIGAAVKTREKTHVSLGGMLGKVFNMCGAKA